MKKLHKEKIKSIYVYVLKHNYKVKVVDGNVRLIDGGYEYCWREKEGYWYRD